MPRRPPGPKVAFRGGAVHIRVPATSANLGPGFDSLGLALSVYDDLVARIGENGLTIDIAGEGADDVPRTEKHLVIRAMRTTFERLGGQPRGIELVCANRIPHSRGLGSSAAAIVGGVLLARALVLGGEEALPDAAALRLASELEGHPDNVAACLLGGLTVAWTEAGRAEAVRLDVDAAVRPVVLIPPFTASTVRVRRLLPAQVPHADAAFNAARASLLVAALTGRPAELLTATEDRLHQPYRAAAMRKSATAMAALRGDGIPAVISGAGPTVLALARDDDELKRAISGAPAGWRAEAVSIEAQGALLLPLTR